ncbi:uncharacterized protein [Narcine bancroftii]|uniref:uncharacterized protein n=1 Tax=Narcine bancroftii TaxID=1343680 RepID=UPI0038318DE8
MSECPVRKTLFAGAGPRHPPACPSRARARGAGSSRLSHSAMAEKSQSKNLSVPTIVIDPSAAPSSPRMKSSTVASKTHLRTIENVPDNRLSWISVSRYNLSRLTLTERVHMDLRDLGAIEILIGLIEMVFGIPMIFAESYSFPAIVGVPWATGFWYLVSGSMTIHLIHSRNLLHKRLVLGAHVVSALAAVLGCVVHNLSLFYLPTTPANYFTTAPLLLSLFLMLFSLVEFVICLLICYLYTKLLGHRR